MGNLAFQLASHTDKHDLKALVVGTSHEENRIGFVAATRARDLLVVAAPSGTPADVIDQLKKHGFMGSDPAQLGAVATPA